MRALALLLLPACATMGGEEDVRDGIADAWKNHLAGVRQKDPWRVGRLYTDDVVYIVPGECEVRGRKAIDEMEAQGLKTVEILDVTHTTEALEVHGDVAYEIGTVVGPVRPHGKPAKTVTFRYIARWRRVPEETSGWHRFEARWCIQYMVGEPDRG